MVVAVLEVTVLPPGQLEMLEGMASIKLEAVPVGAGTPVTGVLGVTE